MAGTGDVTRMLLVTVPEWGHVSPTLNLAAAILRCWDTSKGELQLSLASMEHMRSKVEARGIDFVAIGEWEGNEAAVYARSSRWVTFSGLFGRPCRWSSSRLAAANMH